MPPIREEHNEAEHTTGAENNAAEGNNVSSSNESVERPQREVENNGSGSGSGSNNQPAAEERPVVQSEQHATQPPAQQTAQPPAGDGGAVDNARENVHETQQKVGEARAAISNLMSGKANVVDAAMAVKGAFDSIKGLTGKLSESMMMPVMKALGAIKGQAILPAAKQMDPVMGIDVHMVTIPPSPAPIPMPHPYIGMLFNSRDWVSCLINTFKKDALDALPPPAEDDKSVMASIAKNKEAIAGIAMGLANMGASVKFGDIIPRAITGTPCKSVPHIPMGAGFFPAFDAAIAKNNGKAFLGSLFVVADGDPMVGSFHLNYDCWDVGVPDLFKALRGGKMKKPSPPEPGSPKAELFVPSGTVMPIPIGRPVLVNSIPTPINPMAILDKLFKAGLGKLAKAARRVAQAGLNKLNGRVGCGPLTAASKLVGTGQSHPVDVSSGHFYTDNIDFSLPGPIPLSFERTWYSYSPYKGPLGHGWHHSYDMALAVDHGEEVAIMRLADGRVAHFEIPEIKKEVYNRGEKLTLHLHEDGYYYATDKIGLIYRFTEKVHHNPSNNTQTHLLQSIANRNGFAIRFKYNDQCSLKEITDSAGRILKVNNDIHGRITSIDAPDPRYQGRTTFPIVRYTYSADGDMSAQVDALDQAMHFEYQDHLMVKEVWRNGCVWQLRYDKPSGIDAKCIEVWGTGNLLHYKFDYTDPECTVAINSRGFKKLFYHKNGVVVKFIDPLGAAWLSHYNQYNELEWETDPLGNQKLTTYDDWGNVATVTEANGAFLQFTYGAGISKHLPTESIDKAGCKWEWIYNEYGNLITHTNPLKGEAKYEYEDGLLIKVLNTNGTKTLLHYESSYNLSKVVSENGFEIIWSYDILGNCIKSSDSAGNNRKTEFNILSLPVTIYEPDGNIHYFEFDAEGNVIRTKDKFRDIKLSYDPLKRLLSRNQAGSNISFNYDTEGNLCKLTNENNEVYSFEMDPADRLIKEIGFDGLNRVYIRDKTGKVLKVERPGNKFTKYDYDTVGNIIEVNYHDGSFEKYAYTKNGFLIEAINTDSKISFERDLFGRVTKEINDQDFISCQYDKLENRTIITSSLGANIITKYDDLGNVILTKADAWESTFKYDELGLEIERHLPGNISSQWVRDKIGRPIRRNISNKRTAPQNTQYTWNVNNCLERITANNHETTQFHHDEIGNLIKTNFSDGTEQLRITDPVGNLYNTSSGGDSSYGKGGKLLKRNGNIYNYDDEGNLIEKREVTGKTWKYSWDASGKLKSVIRPDGEIVSFTYDALGRRLTKRFKNTITKWLWNNTKPLHEWKEHAITGVKLSNTNIDSNSIITWLFEEKSFSPIAKLKGNKSYSIITDHLGTPCQMYNYEGEKMWETQLDSYGKVRMHVGEEGSCPFRYQGQYEDVETGLYYNRYRYYSPDEGCYISQDPIGLAGGIYLYKYVKCTNTWIDKFGLLPTCQELDAMAKDAAGRLTRPSAVVVAVGVDKDGNLTVSTSERTARRQVQEWAQENNATVVNSRTDNVHAEEAVYNNAAQKPVRMGSSAPICPDCQNGMDRNNVDYNSENTTDTRSRTRRNNPDSGSGNWPARE